VGAGARLVLRSGAAADTASTLNSLTLGGSGASRGGVDMTDNDLLVFYDGPSPYEMYRQWIINGRTGPAGSQGGIYSSITTLSGAPGSPGTNYPTMIALADNSQLALDGFGDHDFTDNLDVLILKFTYLGDINIDGMVTDADLVNIIAHMNQSGSYFDGDANLDGLINLADYDLVQASLGAGTGLNGSPQLGSPLVAVPEPGTLALVGVAACAMLRRRLRRGDR